MPTPKFILDLREKVGHDLLWLTGITGVVLNDEEQVLLVRRADNGRWSLPAGILEPGEQPAIALLREIQEETAVGAEIVRLVSIEALPPGAYPNGDRVQFLDLCFRCRHLTGTARVNDDESLEVAWFPLTDLPADLAPRELDCISNAQNPTDQPLFTR
ncbi:NUDIX domain-containing protein [Kribbella sancticallisti]|uniref:NUDIX domain-containing protein n=1 Tax=Kribbella sancticallisti TaxID=460087 RepID=A0ABP4QKJ5_9ACTN